jgi:TonB-linked SusC/RagA family outer membrane protein
MLIVSQIYGQNKIITGKVVDLKGEPIIGANVHVENTQNRTLAGIVTDINGSFRLAVPNDKNITISCSFIGYKTQSIAYTGQSILNFSLEEDSHVLDAVEIVSNKSESNALGVNSKEQVSASQKFNMSMMESSPMTTIESALQGRLANVDIVSGGDPGSKSSIRIRGTSSLTASSDPLIVVDGVPYATTISDDFNFNTASDEDLGGLVNISPSDIESIEVLKDAAATAIWGSKGANGVLLFKTKKGTKGKTRFSLSSKVDYKKEPPTIPMLNGSQYVSMVQDALFNTVNYVGYSTGSKYTALLYNTKEINFDPAWKYFDEYNQNTNWINEISQPGYTYDNSLSMSGGGDKATYRVSLGYTNEQGTTIGTSLSRLTSTLNVNYKFSDKLRVNADMSYNQSTTAANWTTKDIDGFSTPRGAALKKLPNMSPYVIDNKGNRTDQYFTPLTNFQGNFETNGIYNPVAMVYEGINNTYGRNAKVNFSLEYNITSALMYRSIVGFDIRTSKNRKYLPQSVTGVLYDSEYYNASSDYLSDQLYITTENKILYNKTIAENHRFVVAAVAQTNEAQSNAYSSSTSGNSSVSLSDPTTGAAITGMGSGSSKNRDLGYIGNIHYAFKEKYLVDAGYRIEASSAMGKNNRWAAFRTLGAGWNFTEENFLRQNKLFKDGKLRLSWGESGNSPSGSYPYIGTLNPVTNYIDMNAIVPSTIQLDNLKWETVTQGNIGLDITFMDKLIASFDVYNKTTSDLLQKDYEIPSSTGYSKVKYYNSGKVTNKGWELVLNYKAITKKDLTLNFNFNISKNINEVLDLPANKDFESYTFKNGAYAYKIVEGNPIGSFYGYKCQGVYQNTEETYAKDASGNKILDMDNKPVIIKNGTANVYAGDAKYQDLNHDGVINQYDIAYLGNAMPLLTGGGGFDIRYQNLTLSAFFHGRYGQKIVNQTRINMENMYGADNQSMAVLRRWRHEGDDTNIPRALYGIGYNYLGSDRFVEDGSFIRLKTLSLTYRVPKPFLQKLKIERLDVWCTGYDLYTWTNYSGQDPEVSLSSNIYLLSVDNASTPKTKHFAIGLTMNF